MQYLILALLGAVSGIISGYTKNFFEFTPGIIFGIILSLYFFHKYSLKLLKTVAWFVASSVSYYIAFQLGSTLAITSGARSEIVGSVPYLCAGILGGLLVALSFSFLIKNLRFLHIILLASWGGVLALSGTGGLPGTLLFVIWQAGMACALYLAMRMNTVAETIQPEISPPVGGFSSPPPLPSSTWVKKLKISGVILFVLLVGGFVYRTLAHDSLVLGEVKTTLQYLEDYYKQHEYYPTEAEFKNANPSSTIFPNPNYKYNSDTYNFNQTYSLRYRLNKPVDDAPGHPIMDWGYKGQSVTSCDTRNVCGTSYALSYNPKGVLWFITPIAYFTAGITMNLGQAISWKDFQTRNTTSNYKWQFSEKQYAGPVQMDFSYDTSLLTKIEPVGPIEGSWYQKGSYFKALKAGETVFKITVSRPFYDTGYENGTYGGATLMETAYVQKVKIKIVDDPTLLDHGYPTEEQRLTN